MKTATKEYILKSFGCDFESDVTYRDGVKVHYMNAAHIKWKNVVKITIKIPRRVYMDPNQNGGDLITRDSVVYRIN